ncbi:hypothetical protein GW17_00034189 [Ensete ventricosum]|nr:hypothetical protein GW17_00034189 [Ensete ventricosum]
MLKGALVGSHKGSCHLYDTSGMVHPTHLLSLSLVYLLLAGADALLSFSGFRNTSSQISAYWTANGRYVICASEDSHVYVWRYDEDSRSSRSKTAASVTQSYEHFHCQGVTVAVPWPCSRLERMVRTHSNKQDEAGEESQANSPLLVEANGLHLSPSPSNQNISCQQNNSILSRKPDHFGDRLSATWPEELMAGKQTPRINNDLNSCHAPAQKSSAWGLVIVTASRCGEIRTFQNFGVPFQI